MKITWLSTASILIEHNHTHILFDPYLKSYQVDQLKLFDDLLKNYSTSKDYSGPFGTAKSELSEEGLQKLRELSNEESNTVELKYSVKHDANGDISRNASYIAEHSNANQGVYDSEINSRIYMYRKHESNN